MSEAPGSTNSTLHLVFAGTRLVLSRSTDGEDGLGRLTPADLLDLGVNDGERIVPVDLTPPDGLDVRIHDLPADFEPAPGYEVVGLREVGRRWPEELFRLSGTALQKLEWIRTHRFCARCGHPTARRLDHQAMACTDCGQLHFPRVAPAVIVLVQRETEMLLGRSPRFAEGVYSTLAGFVEPGESLEETVHREIREEVGVEVANLRYFGSQPWPFPHSLMVGFVADWASGDIVVDGEEIEDARWFSPNRLPPRLPYGLSIARKLVDDFLQRVGGA